MDGILIARRAKQPSFEEIAGYSILVCAFAFSFFFLFFSFLFLSDLIAFPLSVEWTWKEVDVSSYWLPLPPSSTDQEEESTSQEEDEERTTFRVAHTFQQMDLPTSLLAKPFLSKVSVHTSEEERVEWTSLFAEEQLPCILRIGGQEMERSERRVMKPQALPVHAILRQLPS